MFVPQFGSYGFVVILMRKTGVVNPESGIDSKPVPFGLFASPAAAQEWADTELSVRDDEYYVINRVRHVAN